MRIISGKHRGRTLISPKDRSVRPTTDRTRESIFNILLHGQLQGEQLIDQRVVDLCCGTGALGLEALSRGAGFVTFVDQQKNSLTMARKNAETFNESANCEFLQVDVAQLPPPKAPYMLAFLDAPYKSGLINPTLTALLKQGWMEKGAIVVVEHSAEESFAFENDFEMLTERRYGKTYLTILEKISDR